MFSNKNYWTLIAFAFILQVIIYFGFDSAYFSYKSLHQLPDFYGNDIYRYRIFSTELLNSFVNMISPLLNQLREVDFLQGIFSTSGTNFYIAFFLFNTVFFLATLFAFIYVLKMKSFASVSSEKKYFLTVFIILILSISKYVMTPYDDISYFFLILGFQLSYSYINNPKIKTLILFSILIFISTLNRETSALNLSFFAALLLSSNAVTFNQIKKITPTILMPIAAFLLAYVGVRIYFEEAQMIQDNYWINNLSGFKNILGIVFFIVCLKIIWEFGKNNFANQLFLLLCAPYFFVIFMGGILWEFRLFIPVILGVSFLVLNPNNTKKNA